MLSKKDRRNKIKWLVEEVDRLTVENEGIAKILNKRVKPVVEAVEDMWKEEERLEKETGVDYHG